MSIPPILAFVPRSPYFFAWEWQAVDGFVLLLDWWTCDFCERLWPRDFCTKAREHMIEVSPSGKVNALGPTTVCYFCMEERGWFDYARDARKLSRLR